MGKIPHLSWKIHQFSPGSRVGVVPNFSGLAGSMGDFGLQRTGLVAYLVIADFGHLQKHMAVLQVRLIVSRYALWAYQMWIHPWLFKKAM